MLEKIAFLLIWRKGSGVWWWLRWSNKGSLDRRTSLWCF